jgi:hypothetical protein
MVHEGLRTLGAFVLASPHRVLARGDVVVVRVSGAGERQAVRWQPTPTWHEIAFDAPTLRVAMPGADAEVPVLPLSHGIVLASAVLVSRAETTVEEAAVKGEARAVAEIEVIPLVVAAPAETPKPSPAAPGAAGEPHGESRQYDELFTPSMIPGPVPVPGVEATVRLAPGQRSAPRRPAPERDQHPLHAPSPPVPTPPGFIDHLPWAPVGHAADVPSPVSRPEPGVTLQRPPRLPGRVVSVQAVRCPAGHLNPVTGGSCRVCRLVVADGEPVEVVRPRLGVLRLSTDSEPIALERGVVFGREPTTRADVDRIALRQPDISANHVEVRLSGWQVLVVDLGSTNGTVVTGPDGGQTALTPHVPVELRHGAEVALSDEISFRFEVTS